MNRRVPASLSPFFFPLSRRSYSFCPAFFPSSPPKILWPPLFFPCSRVMVRWFSFFFFLLPRSLLAGHYLILLSSLARNWDAAKLAPMTFFFVLIREEKKNGLLFPFFPFASSASSPFLFSMSPNLWIAPETVSFFFRDADGSRSPSAYSFSLLLSSWFSFFLPETPIFFPFRDNVFPE